MDQLDQKEWSCLPHTWKAGALEPVHGAVLQCSYMGMEEDRRLYELTDVALSAAVASIEAEMSLLPWTDDQARKFVDELNELCAKYKVEMKALDDFGFIQKTEPEQLKFKRVKSRYTRHPLKEFLLC